MAANFIALALLAAQPGPCTAPERAELDFWVGTWNVFPTGKTNQVARSLIEKLYDGCAIRENWMPFSNAGGGSLSTYDPGSGRWHQTWVDANGSLVRFEGGRQGASMVMQGLWAGLIGPGKDAIVRMTYTPAPDGSVRQLGVQSVDGGATWQPSFDFTYRRAKAQAARSPSPSSASLR